MRHELYYYFYETLKQFVKDEGFSIKYGLKSSKSLAFYKENCTFYCCENATKFAEEDLGSIYQIIRSYVTDLIAKKQKAAFVHDLKEKDTEKVKLNEHEHEVFCSLVEKFHKYLWEEPIETTDIAMRGSAHRLGFGFENSSVDVYFLCNVRDILHKYPEIFTDATIYSYMWDLGDDENAKMIAGFECLEKEGYVKISKRYEASIYFDVLLKEKFYEAFKKAFYYDYNPRVTRPRGCIYSMI